MKVAYVMSRFPHLSETFILREMEAMEASGSTVVVYPLVVQRPPVMHREAERWLHEVRHVPAWSWRAWGALARLTLARPGRVGRAVARTLWENRASPKFLLRALAVLPMAASAATRMRAEGVEHVHAHYATHPALMAWLVRSFVGIPYSVTVHAHDIFVDGSMLATKLAGAAFVVAISDFNRDYLVRTVGADLRERIHVVRCGIEPARYARPARPSRVGSAVGTRAIEILSVGSLQPYKGQKHLVDACAELARRGIRFRCRIVGEGEERRSLARRIAAAGLDDRVLLAGALPQDRVIEQLHQADVYVQPSVVESSGKMEGIPVALMEAMAAGVPVVATRLSGVPELVQDGVTGVLVAPADATALADAIEAVVREPTIAESRSEAAQELVARSYDLRTNVAALARLMAGRDRGSEPAVGWQGAEAWPA